MPVLKTTSPDLESGAPNEKLCCHANEGTPNPSNTVPSASTNFPFSTSRSMHVSPKFGIIFDSTSGHASSPVSLSITSTYLWKSSYQLKRYGIEVRKNDLDKKAEWQKSPRF